MPNHCSLQRILLAGFILTALPAASLARQSITAERPLELTLPANFKTAASFIQLSTDINSLNLADLSGNTGIAIGDVIYVHLNTSAALDIPSTQLLRYPYAVSQNRPYRSDDSTVSLRGVVTGRDDQTLSVSYHFEVIPSSKDLEDKLQRSENGTITLAVNRRAVGHVLSVKIDEETFTIR